MTSYIFNLISLFGGLALFLFGMDTMGKALERQAGGKLQTILAKMSSTVIKGFLLGAAVTAVILSSSAAKAHRASPKRLEKFSPPTTGTPVSGSN